MDQMVMPILSHVTQILTAFPGKPLVHSGHSMGGLVAVLCARDLPPPVQRGDPGCRPGAGAARACFGKSGLGTIASYICPQMLVPALAASRRTAPRIWPSKRRS
uniref:Hydrolase_4 domain-containing protein n=1 Tax=Macrostomum lignano TaxID=282301 RepID=A0A1I8FCV8_9PLAT